MTNAKERVVKKLQSISCIDMMKMPSGGRNTIRIGIGNTIEHELMKFRVGFALMKRGSEIYTEAIFKNGKRADVVDLDNAIVYEVICSETEKECLEKVKGYPEHFEVRIVNAKQDFKEELLD